jgi:hypothetical protein
MRRALAALAPLLAAALSSGCGSLLSAQLEVPEVRIVQAGQTFDPLNPTSIDLCPPTLSTGCVFRNMSYDIGAQVPAFNDRGVTADVRLLDVAMHLSGADLSAIQGARVLLPDGKGGYTTIASYEKQTVGPPPQDVAVTGRSNLDLGPYISDGKLPVRLEMDYDASGTLSAFTADIEAGFSVIVTVDYTKLL